MHKINRLSSIFRCLMIFLIIMAPLKRCLAENETLHSLLPSSSFLENWKWEEAPLFYQPENLYEYINGSAELYLSYDFKRLITVSFINLDEETVVIDIYDMENPLNAFGVYSVYRSPESQIENIGTEAIVSDYHIRFYKDRYVVDLNASEITDAIQKAMHKLAQALADKIKSSGGKPKEVDLLPTGNLIPKSCKYISNGLLGHKFLVRGLEGLYQLGEHTAKGFIAISESQSNAKNAYQNLINYLEDSGRKPVNWPELGEAAFAGEMPYHQFGLVSQYERFILGVIDLPAAKDGVAIVKAMLRKVKEFDEQQ